MPKYDGLACAQGGTRQNLGVHDFTGGNTKVGKWVRYLFPSDVTQQQVDSGIVRARRTLQKAATMDLEATVEGGSVHAEVTITNETGHKLPSGYPEGRRIWINVKAFDAQQQMIFESGAYNASTGVLTHDEQIKIYEIHPGISPGLADVLGMPSGTSFHFVLNDTVYMDNRIPPRGATNAELAMIQSPVVDYTYADGQYWDISDYDLPLATDSIVATLYYQTTSKEYIEFLRDNNVTSSRGDDLYAMWDTTGKSSPELMEQEYFRVIHPLAAVDDLTIVFDSRILSAFKQLKRVGFAVLFCMSTVHAQQLDLIWEKRGEGPQSRFGGTIFGLGDRNHDGYDDFAVYAWGSGEAGNPSEPMLELFYGGNPPSTQLLLHF
jgi:hypothetical protein